MSHSRMSEKNLMHFSALEQVTWISFLVLDFCDWYQIAGAFQLHPDVTSDMRWAVFMLAFYFVENSKTQKRDRGVIVAFLIHVTVQYIHCLQS